MSVFFQILHNALSSRLQPNLHIVNEDHVLLESGALALCSYSIQYDTRPVHIIILE